MAVERSAVVTPSSSPVCMLEGGSKATNAVGEEDNDEEGDTEEMRVKRAIGKRLGPSAFSSKPSVQKPAPCSDSESDDDSSGDSNSSGSESDTSKKRVEAPVVYSATGRPLR